MSNWREDLRERLTDIRNRKENGNMSDEKNEVTELTPTEVSGPEPAETSIEVVSLGHGVTVDGDQAASGMSKTEARAFAKKIAKENRPAVITVRYADGSWQERINVR